MDDSTQRYRIWSGVIGAFVSTWLLFPAAANACAVCFDASAKTRGAYLGTTIFLTLLPMILVGGVAYWIWCQSEPTSSLSPTDEQAGTRSG